MGTFYRRQIPISGHCRAYHVGPLALKSEFPFSAPVGAYKAPLPGDYILN